MLKGKGRKTAGYFVGGAAIVFGLYFTSLYSYLLFHSLIEIITVAIGLTLFILTWNARRFFVNDYLKILGIGYFFISLIDLFHTLAYKGMNIFPGQSANLPTQLWIAARFLQAATLCAAPVFVKHKINDRLLLVLYFAVVSATASLIYSGHFPDCFIEGKGLTYFKIYSEYFITAILLVSLLLFHRNRKSFSNKVYTLVTLSIICMALAEMSFTTYLSVYGFTNMIGHLLKLAAYYLVYEALLVTGFTEPYELIFRELSQTEEALRKYRDTLEEKVRERTAELSANEEKLKRLNRELQAISNCNQILIRASDEHSLLDEVCRIICDEAGYRMAWAGYAEKDDAKSVRPVAWAGFENDYLAGTAITWDDAERGQGPTGTAIRTGEVVCIQDFISDPRAAPWREAALARSYRSSIALPLMDEALDTFGVLNIYSMEPNAFTPEEIRLLNELADDLAFGIMVLRIRVKRKQAEESLRQLNEELEERVRERTMELARSRDDLQKAYDDLKVAQSRILQQEKMASIGQLAAGVAHEINNPMGFILCNLNTLGKYVGRFIEYQKAQGEAIKNLAVQSGTAAAVADELSALKKSLKIEAMTTDIAGLVAESIEGGERVKNIVQNLKSFARLDEEVWKEADINQCLESTLNIVWNELKFKCTVVKDYGNIPHISCNPGQLNQVFLNLLVNAGQSIEEKGDISIATRREGEWVVVTISDTGKGIPADKLHRIFEPFFTTKEVGKGTGLGLSIAYDIIKKHRGEISVESEADRGSRFTVRLPAGAEGLGSGLDGLLPE